MTKKKADTKKADTKKKTDKKQKPQKPDIRKIDKFTEMHPVELTDKELLDFADSLARCDDDISNQKRALDSIKKELNAKISEVESRRSRLSTIIFRKEEMRDVEVETALFFDADEWRKTRLDTGEIVDQRPIRLEERQENIELTK